MFVLVFFGVVILFSLALSAVDKIRSYKSDEKSLWEDGDSVRVKRDGKDKHVGEEMFMTKIS